MDNREIKAPGMPVSKRNNTGYPLLNPAGTFVVLIDVLHRFYAEFM